MEYKALQILDYSRLFGLIRDLVYNMKFYIATNIGCYQQYCIYSVLYSNIVYTLVSLPTCK